MVAILNRRVTKWHWYPNFSYRSVQPVYSVRWYKVKYITLNIIGPVIICQVKSDNFYFNCFAEWEGVLQLQTRETQPYHGSQPSRHQCWCEWPTFDCNYKTLPPVKITIICHVFFHTERNFTPNKPIKNLIHLTSEKFFLQVTQSNIRQVSGFLALKFDNPFISLFLFVNPILSWPTYWKTYP